jgi:hypothetical protein
MEVSVGKGANWPYLNQSLDFYGFDSLESLRAYSSGQAAISTKSPRAALELFRRRSGVRTTRIGVRAGLAALI